MLGRRRRLRAIWDLVRVTTEDLEDEDDDDDEPPPAQ